MTSSILKLFARAPDFIIGPHDAPYLERWWIIPRNRFFNIYLHRISKSDDDRALHDHPWWNISILLRGSYVEVMPDGEIIRRPGDVVFRKATALHRLVVDSERPVWSLFITGRRVREWGFQCPNGWRHWQEFVDARDSGQIGRGCD